MDSAVGGLSTGDFREGLAALLREEASSLSPTAITRLTAVRGATPLPWPHPRVLISRSRWNRLGRHSPDPQRGEVRAQNTSHSKSAANSRSRKRSPP